MSGPPEKADISPEPQVLCPRWLCFAFDNPLRRLVQNPKNILKQYVKEGFTVLDVGPGIGYFTIPLARMVGDSGKVIAADIQPQMLEGVRRRALKAGIADRIRLHLGTPDSIGIRGPIDFCLAFWMVHEVPDRSRFINEIAFNLKPGGQFLVSEPKLHVSKESYDMTLEIAKSAGLILVSRPKIFISNSALLKK
jgi:ubiquinone/menaquinone biosynthesis C-methylase UbiE